MRISDWSSDVCSSDLSGGKALTERKGNFVLPTLITGLDNKAEVVQTETFAPILYVMKYSTLEDAIAMQNDVPQGLSPATLTPNLKAAEAFLSATGSDSGLTNNRTRPVSGRPWCVRLVHGVWCRFRVI